MVCIESISDHRSGKTRVPKVVAHFVACENIRFSSEEKRMFSQATHFGP